MLLIIEVENEMKFVEIIKKIHLSMIFHALLFGIFAWIKFEA
jgi:hypothetical protein